MKKGLLAGGIGFLAMTLLTVPMPAYAAGDLGQVHVTVENTTFSKSAGAPWEGVLVDTWVDLDSKSTMMSCIYTALGSIPSEGADGTYIKSINGLEEFDGGSMSGWMGTLNDWFTDAGFHEFKVSEGELYSGDEIHVMYTCEYGVDLGSSWENKDKSLKGLNFSTGTLTPAFQSATTEYQLEIPEDTAQIKVSPTAVNKSYQVRTYKGDTLYRRPETISVTAGDTLTVKIGDPSWPSMMEDDSPAKTYSITVVKKTEEPETDPEPEPEPPAAPTLGGIKNTSTGVNVTWKAVEGADLYRVYRKTGSGGWVKQKDQTSLSFTDTTVTSGTSYSYTVRCRRDGLWSTYDKTGKTITWLSQPVVKLANKADGVTVTWAKVTGATSYIVYRKTGSGGWVNQGSTTALTFTDKTAASGTTYYYTVKAAKGKIYSTYDTTKKILRLAQPKVTVTKVTGGIKASWAKVTGATSYIVYRKTGSSGSWTKLATVTGTSYTDKTAKSGTTYYYTVKAANGTTYSSYTASSAIKR